MVEDIAIDSDKESVLCEDQLVLSRTAYIKDAVVNYLRILDEADKIARSFPVNYRNAIEARASIDINAEIFLLAGSMAELSQIARDEFRASLEMIMFLAKEDIPEDIEAHGCLTFEERDEHIIILVIRFLSKLGDRSKKQLETFLVAALENSVGFVTMQTDGKTKEARHSYDIPAEFKKFLRLAE